MSVGDSDHDSFARQPGLLPNCFRHSVCQVTRHADQVARHKHELFSRLVLKCQSFYVKVLKFPLGRLVPIAITGHPHGLPGRDDLESEPRLVTALIRARKARECEHADASQRRHPRALLYYYRKSAFT